MWFPLSYQAECIQSVKILITKCTWYAMMADRYTGRQEGGDAGRRISFGIWNFRMSLNYCNIIRTFIWQSPRGCTASVHTILQEMTEKFCRALTMKKTFKSLKSLENWAPTDENCKLATDNWGGREQRWDLTGTVGTIDPLGDSQGERRGRGPKDEFWGWWARHAASIAS